MVERGEQDPWLAGQRHEASDTSPLRLRVVKMRRSTSVLLDWVGGPVMPVILLLGGLQDWLNHELVHAQHCTSVDG